MLQHGNNISGSLSPSGYFRDWRWSLHTRSRGREKNITLISESLFPKGFGDDLAQLCPTIASFFLRWWKSSPGCFKKENGAIRPKRIILLNLESVQYQRNWSDKRGGGWEWCAENFNFARSSNPSRQLDPQSSARSHLAGQAEGCRHHRVPCLSWKMSVDNWTIR